MFDPPAIFGCGQCFRWKKQQDDGDVYTGVAYGQIITVSLKNNALTIENIDKAAYDSVWQYYFGLHIDYKQVVKRLSSEKKIIKAVEYSPGLRIMRQEPWEMLVTFILSQRTNIPRIIKMVDKLCMCFGEPLGGGHYTFPGPESLAKLSNEDLGPIRSGYRAAYITDAARKVACGMIDLDSFYNHSTEDIYKALLTIHGVGPKVADCILLYGYGRLERVPRDIWIERVMKSLYPNGFPDELSDIAGLAQLYLFNYARNNKGNFV